MRELKHISPANAEALNWCSLEELSGRSLTCETCFAESDIDAFAELSGDTSHIHMSDDAAKQRGFKARVVHGVLQMSVVSAMVGTLLPGHRSVLQKTCMSYRKPVYAGDKLVFQMRVKAVHENLSCAELAITVRNEDGVKVSTGQIQVGVSND